MGDGDLDAVFANKEKIPYGVITSNTRYIVIVAKVTLLDYGL